MNILHLADIHACKKLFEQVKRCCNFVADYTGNSQIDLIVIAGDIFDIQSIKLDSDVVRFMFKWVSVLSNMAPVFIVKGTRLHEGNTIKALESVSGIYDITVADYPGTWLMTSSGNFVHHDNHQDHPSSYYKCIISAMPTPTKEWITDDLKIQDSNDQLASCLTPIFAGFGSKASEFPDLPHVLTGHFCVRGAAISEDQVMIGREIEIGLDQILMTRADLTCLGHIHKAQNLGHEIFYSGSLPRKNQGETEDKGFYIHDFNHGKPAEFIVVPADKLLRIRADFTDGIPLDRLDEVLSLYPNDELKDVYLKIEFTMWQDAGREHSKESIKKVFKDCECADVKVDLVRKPRANIRNEEVVNAETYSDMLQVLATQNSETIPDFALDKMEMLETMPADDVIKRVDVETGSEVVNHINVAMYQP